MFSDTSHSTSAARIEEEQKRQAGRKGRRNFCQKGKERDERKTGPKNGGREEGRKVGREEGRKGGKGERWFGRIFMFPGILQVSFGVSFRPPAEDYSVARAMHAMRKN